MKVFLIFLTSIFASTLLGQSVESPDNHSGHHDHHKNELGVANSAVWFVKEKTLAYGLHAHYIRFIPKSRFGMGVGYERIFGEHKHNTFGIVGTFSPLEGLNLNVSPGLTFEDGNSTISFALHLETSYEFEIKNFHVGPAIEFAYDPEDYHISVGIHVGYGF